MGLLESDVDSLRQRLEQLEREESRKVLEVESERKRRELEEERRKHNEAEEAREQKQQEMLLINLGMSFDDCPGGGGGSSLSSSAVSGPPPTSPFTFENNFLDQIVDRSEAINSAFSQPTKFATMSSQGRNRDCKAGSTSAAAVSADKRQVGSLQRNVSRTKHDSPGAKKPQTMKDKVSEAFSFLDEELKFKKEGGADQRRLHLNKSVGMAKVNSPASVRKLVPSTHEFRKNKGDAD